jgi:DNA-directed RNA polymerase specialized sigma24 family protein
MDLVPERAPGFEERFTALAAISYRVGYRRVGDRAEAEDLAQETLTNPTLPGGAVVDPC